MFEILLFVVIVLLAKLFFDYGYQYEDYFKDKGIKYLKPYFLIGNSGNLFTRRKTLKDMLIDIYFKFPEEKLFGSFEFRSPRVVLRDPELVKQLAVKEFDHFSTRRSVVSADDEPVFGNSLLSLNGEKWKEMRSTLSPAFTGSKMRLMFGLMSECAKQMVVFLNKVTKEKGPPTYEMKDFSSKMGTDIIATCAYGIQVNSLEHQDNEFYVNAKEMLNITKPLRLARVILFFIFPKLCKNLGISIFPKHIIEYFRNVIMATITYREKNNVYRPDMIQLLMEAKKGKLAHNANENDSAGFATVEESHHGKRTGKKDLSDADIFSQCILFFVAGYETISTTFSFTCYELAVNPDVQDKLFEEIRNANEELGEKSLDYDTLQKMKYLDMVVTEDLRKWPGMGFVDRKCTKEIVIDDGKGLRFEFVKDDTFVVPVFGFHYDPQYFPNPDKFDPERFSDENKHKIVPGTYLPFGVGPRNCIGSRFALVEIKVLLYYLILNFKIEATEKTQIPLKLTKDPIMKPEKGIWVQLTPRSQP
uniref:Putative cytochrome p450 9b2 n=1 Tax=Phlebotomus kandelakii TaxID=1109342 RepID=A0A6B2E9E1_9DIPT